jgi:hypothetical protein
MTKWLYYAKNQVRRPSQRDLREASRASATGGTRCRDGHVARRPPRTSRRYFTLGPHISCNPTSVIREPYQATTNEPATYANANAAPLILDAPVVASDAETQHTDIATTVADEPAKCAATATTESTASIPLGSATFPKHTQPRRSRFGPLFQVWHEWSSHSVVSQQATCPRIRKPVMTSRTA